MILCHLYLSGHCFRMENGSHVVIILMTGNSPEKNNMNSISAFSMTLRTCLPSNLQKTMVFSKFKSTFREQKISLKIHP